MIMENTIDMANTPLKLTINELKSAVKFENYWEILVSVSILDTEIVKKFHFKTVWIQATIEQVTLGEIFLVSDTTGKAKIINCKTAAGPYEKTWMSGINVYCNIIGSLTAIKGLPQIEAQQLIPIDKEEAGLMKTTWPVEIKDSRLFFMRLMKPNLNINL